MTTERGATVLTGATGFLGRELLRVLLADPGKRVVAPIRPSRGATPEERLARLLEALVPDEAERAEASQRVVSVETDLAADDPALAEKLRRATGGLPTQIIHGAASVAFDLPLEVTRRINVAGTERLLAAATGLADAGLLTRFAYVSTAFVAGDRSGRVYEHELDVGQGFTNSYERSKLEAEKLVRTWEGRLPVSVFRPSIVAGRAATGETSQYHVLYWPLKVFARGLVIVIPGDRDAVFDIVPVDFVAEALVHILASEDSVGGCYHLSAGSQVTLADMVDLATEIFEPRRVPPYVSPRRIYPLLRPLFWATLIGPFRRVFRIGDVYIPYLSKQLVFDNTATRAALQDSGLRMPDMGAYLKTIMSYAKATDFGRRAPPGM